MKRAWLSRLPILPGFLAAGFLLCASVAGCRQEEKPSFEESTALSRLLGEHLDGARLLLGRDNDLAILELDNGKLRELAAFPKQGGRFDVRSRALWSVDGTRIVVANAGKGYIISPGSARTEQIPIDRPVFSPSFWDDPRSGERCVVFNDICDKYRYGKLKPDGRNHTLLYRTGSGRIDELFEFPCDNGLTPDGTHLGETYGGCMVVDLAADKVYELYNGRQSCNGSWSPDNTYRFMHLYLPHDTFGVRNKFDKELWRIDKPQGAAEWQNPGWSNHPDFCTATARFGDEYKPVVIRMSTREMVVLKSLPGSWNAPHLWLPSVAGAVPASDNPVAGLRLKRYADYVERVGRARDYSVLLTELAADDHPEARLIVETLESSGRRTLETALQIEDALEARALYNEVAHKYADHQLGRLARESVADPAFVRRIEATPLLRRMAALENKLHTPATAGKRSCDDPDFLARNRVVLSEMAALATDVRTRFPDLPEAGRAARIAARYALPDTISTTTREPLEVLATVEAVSRVPTAQEIAPYREVITFVVYRVDKVLEGSCEEPLIVVGHWGMRDRKPTAAAAWKPGLQQQLSIDLFDDHRELEDINLAEDASEDHDLLPYWALKVGDPRRES